jgi:hypothetical protein
VYKSNPYNTRIGTWHQAGEAEPPERAEGEEAGGGDPEHEGGEGEAHQADEGGQRAGPPVEAGQGEGGQPAQAEGQAGSGTVDIHNINPNRRSVGDPHVFGPPGSGSIAQMYGSGSFLFLINVLGRLK